MPRIGIGLRPPTALVPRGGHIFFMRGRARFRTWSTDNPSWWPFSYVCLRRTTAAFVHKRAADDAELGPGYSSRCIFMHHHKMWTHATRREGPQRPSQRPLAGGLCRNLHPNFGESPFHALR
jgi:hypothetical protein